MVSLMASSYGSSYSNWLSRSLNSSLVTNLTLSVNSFCSDTEAIRMPIDSMVLALRFFYCVVVPSTDARILVIKGMNELKYFEKCSSSKAAETLIRFITYSCNGS